MQFRRASLPLVALTAFATCAQAQILKAGPGYKFRVKYTAGQAMQFSTSISFANKGSGMENQVVSVPMTIRVLTVLRGIANVRIDIGAGTIGKSTKPVTPSSSTMVQLNSLDASKIGTPKFPEHAIKIGDTWSADRPVTLLGNVEKLDAVYRFAGIKTVGKTPLAVITYSLSGPAVGSGTMMLSVKDASIVTNDMLISVHALDPTSKLHIYMKRTK